MLMTDYTAEFLNLEGVFITNVENISNQLHIHIELSRKDHICPCCGAVTDRVHDYRMQVIKDVPMARDTFLHLRKRRYRCNCGKRFFSAIRSKSAAEGRKPFQTGCSLLRLWICWSSTTTPKPTPTIDIEPDLQTKENRQ